MQKIDHGLKDNPMAGKVICGYCGKVFWRRTWNCTGEKLKRKVWFYNGRYVEKETRGCNNKHIDDKILNQSFVYTFNVMIDNKDYFIEKRKANLKSENALVRYKAKEFIKIIEKSDQIREFDVDLLFIFVEKMTVFHGKKIIVSSFGRTQIDVVIE